MQLHARGQPSLDAPTTEQGPGPGLRAAQSLPNRPARLRLCFLRLEAGTGRSRGSQGRAQARAPFLSGSLGAALCLPQSAPSTKVARQVPGRRQRSRSGSAWLPGAESEGAGAPDTQNERQKGAAVWGPMVSPTWVFLVPRTPCPRKNRIPKAKRTLNPRVPRRKANAVGAHTHYTLSLILSGKCTLRIHSSPLLNSIWHKGTHREGPQVINKEARRGSNM